MEKQTVKKQKIKAVILAGCRDFGRCPVATRLPTALWPVLEKPALEHLLVYLAKQGIKQATICSNGDSSLLEESIHVDKRLDIKFLSEKLPAGTAGCIRDTISDKSDALILVLPASIVSPPSIEMLLNAHRQGQSDLTVMFNPNYRNGKLSGEPAGIYVCESSILEHIPNEGYFDIKEGLIPEMLRSGKTVHAAVLPNHVGNFRNRQQYLYAIANYLENATKPTMKLKLCKRTDSQILWLADNTNVDLSARIYGPVAIMDGACVLEGAVIFGPTIIGQEACIGKNSVVSNSVIWDKAQVGENCEVQQCVIDYKTALKSNTVVEATSIAFKPETVLESLVNRTLKPARNIASKLKDTLQAQIDKFNEKLPNWVQLHKANTLIWLATCLVIITFLWSYRAGLTRLWSTWQRSDEYSSGILVPFLAVYILWSRRYEISKFIIKPSIIWGIFVFLAAQGIRLYFGLYLNFSSAERLSIVISIVALVLLWFGWQFFRKISTVLLFLCLMLPWPNRVQAAIALPLQRSATSSAVFCLETMGYEAIQEGNIIHIGQSSVAVAEACNGLRMITAFFVISGLVVLLVKRAWWEKLIILASSLPIALLCNTTRLTITAIAFTILDGEHWEKIFHDFGGYAMMPLSLAAVVVELWLLEKLTMPPIKKEAIMIVRK